MHNAFTGFGTGTIVCRFGTRIEHPRHPDLQRMHVFYGTLDVFVPVIFLDSGRKTAALSPPLPPRPLPPVPTSQPTYQGPGLVRGLSEGHL